jgi:site-specific recombinase XerD
MRSGPLVKLFCFRRQEILQTYQHHLREVAGLSPKTCQNHGRDISRFLEAVPIGQAAELAQLTPVDLMSYLGAQTHRSASEQRLED